MTFAPSRQEKLQAEMIVQLGNIVEELRKIKWGGGDTTELEEKITELTNRVTVLTANNNQLSQALAAANALVTELQGQLSNSDPTGSDPTPDDINAVFSSLGISDDTV